MSDSSSIRISTIVAVTAGTIVAGGLGTLESTPRYKSNLKPHLLTLLFFLAYALYFDHKRRSDPGFRKALKRESRKEARAAKEQAEAQGAQQRRMIKEALDEAKEEGFPTDVEEKETYFMNEVARGEALCQDGVYP